MADTPQGQVLRRLPLVAGMVGGSVLLINRLGFTPELLPSQSRADALGILLSALLILTGLLWQQVDPPQPERVELQGIPGFEYPSALAADQLQELGWLTHTLLTVTAIRSLVILWRGKVILRRGVLRDPAGVVPESSVLSRVIQTQKPIYLVDLKTYPARQEFLAFLPAGIQSVLCYPLGSAGILVAATDVPRSLTPKDQRWIAALADRLAYVLQNLEVV
ncbi:MAG: cofactor assembly of complex C subunit B [Thermostichales cyanobacterium BF4_bins_65]